MNKHAISIKWSDEDNSFIATIPGIQGLSAFGITRNKALSELDIAAEAYFESLKNTDRPFPYEEKIILYSGQLRLRMPKSLHAALASGAENDGVSLNTYIITLLSEGRIEKELLKKVKNIEKIIKVMNSREMPDPYDTSQPIHKIEESNRKYRSKKNKINTFPK